MWTKISKKRIFFRNFCMKKSWWVGQSKLFNQRKKILEMITLLLVFIRSFSKFYIIQQLFSWLAKKTVYKLSGSFREKVKKKFFCRQSFVEIKLDHFDLLVRMNFCFSWHFNQKVTKFCSKKKVFNLTIEYSLSENILIMSGSFAQSTLSLTKGITYVIT